MARLIFVANTIFLGLFIPSFHQLIRINNVDECISYAQEDNISVKMDAMCDQAATLPAIFVASDERHLLTLVYDYDDNIIDCNIEKNPDKLMTFAEEFDKERMNQRVPGSNPMSVERFSVLNPSRTEFNQKLQDCRRFQKRLEHWVKKRHGITEGRTRNKREMEDMLMWPGSKWCGHGSTAEHPEDYGERPDMDKCCKQHDQCPYVIEGFTRNYNYFNWQIHTLNHCDCDKSFETCLKSIEANATAANFLGKFYFNLVNRKCFTLELQKVCTEYSWWGECQKKELKWTALVKENNISFG